MGNALSRGGGQGPPDVEAAEVRPQNQGVEPVPRGTAIKRSHAEENDNEDEIDALMRTPKKKKLKTTSR